MNSPLIDTHCHLDDPRLAEDRKGVLKRAKEVGITQLITIGCAKDSDSLTTALNIAKEYSDWIFATIGFHPHDAKFFNPELATQLEEIAKDEKIVAIGEMGLDYYYDSSPRDIQQEAFRAQIQIAKRLKKRIIVHTRDAAEDTLQILDEENAAEVGGIIHCFSEDKDFAKRSLEMNFISSFSGIVTFKNSKAIQEAAIAQPLDAILVETDSPYLAPIPKRGKRNEPAFVSYTSDFIADLRGIDREEFRNITTKNAKRWLNLP